MRFRDADVRPRGPAPVLGQHTHAVLAAAGLSAAEIEALVASGAVQGTRTASEPGQG
jgi:crotonobetainyl-CoA:carnitine CoA-transferase CaiB-like acyl-CoA transferase